MTKRNIVSSSADLTYYKMGDCCSDVLPISTMFESGEVREWRANRLLKENTLLSVVTFPPELFYPVGVHTLGVVIKKGILAS